jgi:hypothetical protein
VCHKVNNQIEQIYHLFDSTMVPSQLEFLTISFDLKNDDLVKIKRYRERFGKDINGWNFALPYQTDQETFNRFLNRQVSGNIRFLQAVLSIIPFIYY